jgi:glycosyltransferase involved in cell wall biosynthesis
MIDNEKNDDFCPTVLNTIPPGKEGPASPCKIEVHDRPLITFALIAYNQERFIREAVNGAFSQTYSPLEIILSDDCSTDNTYDIMAEMARNYNGPHKIILNRNPVNRGIGAHINRVMEISKGELIVGAAGDDVSLPERVQENYDAFVKSGQTAMSIHSSVLVIDETGRQLGVTHDFLNGYSMDIEKAVRNGSDVWGCSHAWHRKVFIKFGPLHDDVVLEDMTISFRSLILGKIVHIKKPLVFYRLHGKNYYGDKSMVENRLRKFHSPEELNSWRIIKLTNSLTTQKQYMTDICNGRESLGKKTEEKLKKYIKEQIDDIKIELCLRKSYRNKELIKNILINTKNPIQLIRRIIIFLSPRIFQKLSFEKWRFQSLLFNILSKRNAIKAVINSLKII